MPGPDFMGGYCFLNNAAVAVQDVVDQGAKRVVVLDVDYHHGNGTQSIFYSARRCAFISIHGDPLTEYPFIWGMRTKQGEGARLGFNLNLPLPAGSSVAKWFAALDAACTRISQYAPMLWWCGWGWTPMWVIPSRNLRWPRKTSQRWAAGWQPWACRQPWCWKAGMPPLSWGPTHSRSFTALKRVGETAADKQQNPQKR